MSGMPNWCLTGSGAPMPRRTRQVERPNAAAPTWPLTPLCGWDRATPPSPRSTSSGRSSIPALPHSASIATTPRQLSGLLADIRAVAGRILASATADDWRRVLPADLDAAYAAAQQRSRASAVSHEPKPGRAAPAHAVTAAAGVTAALAILNVADVQAAARAMQWLIDEQP